MGGFRGTDETLDREIRTLEAIARLRLKRATLELRELDKDLRELKIERARRKAPSTAGATASAAATA
ncbi:MAG: hypothetical protein L3K17_01760 [Thermoplasmata archaeon]|nr:hypothetical protein [Thermoplasmata archaeon]